MIEPSTPAVSSRQQEILQFAVIHKIVRISDLAARLGVHEMTVRRDIDALCKQGRLRRIHGGAQLVERTNEEVAHHLRKTQNVSAKKAIARAALELIQEGDTIALDASTSAFALIPLLPTVAVQVMASSLDAANLLASKGIPFLLIGGDFHGPARSFVGNLFDEAVRRIHPDIVFFSAKGYTPELGFTDAHLPEVGSKRSLIDTAQTVVALVDSSKFGRTALATIATPKEVDIVITDKKPDNRVIRGLEHDGVKLIVAGK